MDIKVNIVNDILKFENFREIIVSGTRNYYKIEGNFSSDWDGAKKYAVFPDFEYSVALDGLDCCVIPEEFIEKCGVIRIGFIGYENSGNVRICTNYASIRIIAGATEADTLPPVPEKNSPWEEYIMGEISKISIVAGGVASIGGSVDGAYLTLKNDDKHLSDVLLEAGNYIIIEPVGDSHIIIKANIPNANTSQKGLMTSTHVSKLNEMYNAFANAEPALSERIAAIEAQLNGISFDVDNGHLTYKKEEATDENIG